MDTNKTMPSTHPIEWENFKDWELVLPPNRPGKETLSHLWRIISRQENIERVAVLGSTAEYLDLLVAAGAREVICIDKNKEFNAFTQSFRRFPSAETLIIGDWLDTLPRLPSSFDLIISDFTLGNLNYREQEKFLYLISKALRPGGRYVDRVLTYRQPCYEYSDLLGKFYKLPSNLVTLNTFNAMWLFCGKRVEQTGLVDTSATYEWTAENFSQPHIQWLVRNCPRLSPANTVWYYGRPWSMIQPAYSRYFNITEEIPEPRYSPYYGWAFILNCTAAVLDLCVRARLPGTVKGRLPMNATKTILES
jgi:SAM-dependent methyltransferase